MSYSYASYDTQDPPRRHRSERHRDRRSRRDAPPPDYRETTYVEKREGPIPSGHMELIRRTRDDSDEYVEEVRRDFPPGDGAYHQRRGAPRDQYAPRRARSADRGRYKDDYYGGESRGSRRDRRGERSYHGSILLNYG